MRFEIRMQTQQGNVRVYSMWRARSWRKDKSAKPGLLTEMGKHRKRGGIKALFGHIKVENLVGSEGLKK